VKDTGIGIPPELLPRLFNLFTQVDGAVHRAQGGLGIGLGSFASWFTCMAAQFLAHSEGEGRGSEFIVRLPRLVTSRHASRRRRPARAAEAAGRRARAAHSNWPMTTGMRSIASRPCSSAMGMKS